MLEAAITRSMRFSRRILGGKSGLVIFNEDEAWITV